MRQDRQKRNYGGATQRTAPSIGCSIIHQNGWDQGNVLDFGCGFGFDAKHFGWDAYDPFYGPFSLETDAYDTIVCNGVLNAISRKHRADALENIQQSLRPGGKAYCVVARNLPRGGKGCDMGRRQYYVVLKGVTSMWKDKTREIYLLEKTSRCRDAS